MFAYISVHHMHNDLYEVTWWHYCWNKMLTVSLTGLYDPGTSFFNWSATSSSSSMRLFSASPSTSGPVTVLNVSSVDAPASSAPPSTPVSIRRFFFDLAFCSSNNWIDGSYNIVSGFWGHNITQAADFATLAQSNKPLFGLDSFIMAWHINPPNRVIQQAQRTPTAIGCMGIQFFHILTILTHPATFLMGIQ